jgi:site-specific recombinase XerD
VIEMVTPQPHEGAPLVQHAASPIELAIVAWLHAKYHRTKSEKTLTAYRTTLASYRAVVQAAGLDLDGDGAALALLAQQWAALGDVAPSTHNHRLAVVSSFYRYAITQQLLPGENPIERVDRAPVQAYAHAQPIRSADVRTRLKRIPHTTLTGMRDYALLAVALQTGRRLSELVGLRWRAVHAEHERVTLTWERAKGGKVLRDTLPAPVSRAVLRYLHALYGAHLDRLPSDAPIWVSLSRRNHRAALGVQSVADICARWLGTSKVHALRHTFARTMEDQGAKVSDIQQRLGHRSLATTGLYLAALASADNQHADALAGAFGFDDEPRA